MCQLSVVGLSPLGCGRTDYPLRIYGVFTLKD
jgi:hypothetical protein